MLFNSYAFIFLFLPVFLGSWQITAYLRPKLLNALLPGFSLLYYSFWGIEFLLPLAILIGITFGFGHLIAINEGKLRKAALICGIIATVAPLLWFKYSWFLISNLALLFNAHWQFTPPVFPPGISFYTFILIAWLVGVYRQEIVPVDLQRHALFSCCFPYVLSGPITRYQQIGWQFDNLAPATASGLAAGFTLFTMGLAKKAILADSIGVYADAVFNAADKAWPIACGEAWLGSFCYTFQLYFDFSGYTDMALGIGLMIGLRLPENFNSPYKATGIVDFWRRWHMTLSSWLRDFLYIPLGGNRKGKWRQYLNLFLTMLIGGAWHGAGWTYIVWGALHGLMLCVNHFFRSIIKYTPLAGLGRLLPLRLISILFTFLCLNFCWVVFRARSLDAALAIYKAMFTAQTGIADSHAISAFLPNNYITGWQPLALLGLCALLCWFFPNSQNILNGKAGILSWKPTRAWAAGLAILSFVSLALLTRQTVFLYFQF